jgi:hypothetical protein
MKKRLFIGLLVGAMCVGLVGCGGDSSNTGSDGNGSSASVSTESEESKISTMLPDINSMFSDANVSIMFDRADRYTAYVTPASQDDYKAYNDEVSAIGVFTDREKYVCADDGGHARYHDADGKYELYISWDTKDNGSINIKCYTTFE